MQADRTLFVWVITPQQRSEYRHNDKTTALRWPSLAFRAVTSPINWTKALTLIVSCMLSRSSCVWPPSGQRIFPVQVFYFDGLHKINRTSALICTSLLLWWVAQNVYNVSTDLFESSAAMGCTEWIQRQHENLICTCFLLWKASKITTPANYTRKKWRKNAS